MPAAGVGWWTPWLATAPGARINVSLKIQGKDLQPTDSATPAVYLQFINATGRQMTRSFLVGKDAHGKVRRPEFTQGSYGWTEIKETITAPETAVRTALFLGMQPCRGEIGFDDIHSNTENGEKPASEVEITEADPPRIAKERMREIIFRRGRTSWRTGWLSRCDRSPRIGERLRRRCPSPFPDASCARVGGIAQRETRASLRGRDHRPRLIGTRGS
jgi:hypothetical protein